MPRTRAYFSKLGQRDAMHVPTEPRWQCCPAVSTRRLNDSYDFCETHFTAFFVGPSDVRAGEVVWKVVAL